MKQFILKLLADLRFAIFLLLAIAFLSILGTIIEQDQSLEFYKLNYPLSSRLFGFLSWDLILNLGLDHVYTTSWYLLLIFLFAISLLTCTFIQQVPSFKIVRRCQFFRVSSQFLNLVYNRVLTTNLFYKILFNIQKIDYSVFQQRNILYCYKGVMGKLAPITVHLSMILILFGSIISSLGGFRAQEIIPKTESTYIQNLINIGPFTTIPLTTTRINDFWITYNEKTIINQFYSDISILDNQGNEIQQQTVFVNSPAKYSGTVYYQTDWNLLGLRFRLNNSRVLQSPLISILNNRQKFWISWISTDPALAQGLTLLVNDLQGYSSLYDNSGKFLGNLEVNEIFSRSFQLTLIDILSSTGLQIKFDPGIPFIYIGFAILMASTLISYITYSQIWIFCDSEKMFIGGTTNRAKLEFEFEFLNLL